MSERIRGERRGQGRPEGRGGQGRCRGAGGPLARPRGKGGFEHGRWGWRGLVRWEGEGGQDVMGAGQLLWNTDSSRKVLGSEGNSARPALLG